MTKKVINTGTTANDHTGDSLRSAAVKINDNFTEIYEAIGNGSTPGLATVAKSGSYNHLSDKPQVNDLSGYQTQVVDLIPTDVNQLTDVDNLLDPPTYAWDQISNKPTLFSGSYNDLTNKPTIPSVTGLASETYVNNAISSAVQDIESGVAADLSNYALAQDVPTDVADLTDNTNLLTAPIQSLQNGAHSVTLQSDGKLLVDAAGVKFNDNTTQTTAYPGSSILNGYATETYVSTSVSTAIDDLIASAPSTYDTLKEIADQLSSDTSAIGSITTSLASKANSADLATVATSGSYNDLTNKPTLFSGSYNDLTNKPVIDYTTTNQFFVDPARADTYTPTGSVMKPYKSIAAAQTAIEALISANQLTPSESNPVFIVLENSTTENITLSRGHVYLVTFNGGIHTPIYVNGTITVNGSTGSIDTNHFSLQGISVIAPEQKACIHFAGSNPQRLMLKDVWLTAQGTRTGSTPLVDAGGFGVYAANSGSGSEIVGSDIKVTHTGSGDVYCFKINEGNASFTNVETFGATQVASVADSGKLTFTTSTLTANGDLVAEVYGTAELVIVQSSVINTQANSNGIQLNASTSKVTLSNSYLSIPTGTGKAIFGVYESTLYHSGNVFAFGTNAEVSPEINAVPLTTLSPLSAVNPIFTGVVSINGSSISFEGAAPDNFETLLTVANPTADRTVTIPNANGTIMLDSSIYANIDFNNGGSIYALNSDMQFWSESSIVLRPQNNGSVFIQSDDGATQWEFNGTNITFPDNSVQTGAAISVAELKTLVASSVDFADFQSKIAAL